MSQCIFTFNRFFRIFYDNCKRSLTDLSIDRSEVLWAEFSKNVNM